jgi:hypothetical protein
MNLLAAAGANAMPHVRFTSVPLVLTAVAALALAAAPASAQAPRSAPAPSQQPQPVAQVAAPRPYQAVPVTLPQPSGDPSFAAFRMQVADIANRRDRGALARVVANNFFWMGEKGDKANRKKSGLDNLAAVADLNAQDGSGWDALAHVIGDPTLERLPDRKGVMCSPASPTLDQKTARQLAKDTGTQPDEWAYTTRPGIEAHAAAQPDAPVVETLAGVQLVRVMPEDAPGVQPTFVRVVTPGGKVGFIRAEFVKTFPESQVCYIRSAGGWKIAGIVGE